MYYTVPITVHIKKKRDTSYLSKRKGEKDKTRETFPTS